MSPWPRFFSSFSKSLAVVCLSVAASAAQSAEAQVDLRPQWKVGDRVRYELTKTRSQQGSSRDTSATTHTDVQLQVLEAGEDGFLVRAAFGETRFDDPQAQKEPLARQLANLMKDLGIQMVVGRDGEVRRIRNWEEVRTSIAKATQLFADFLKQSGAPAAMVEQLPARLNQSFSTEDSIKIAVLRDLSLLFLPLGKTYTNDAPIRYDSELPTLTGAGTLRSHNTLELTALDNGKGRATVRWTQSVDPQGLAEVTAAATEKLSGKPAPRSADGPPMSLHDSAEFVVDTRSGWPVSIAHTRKVESGPASRTDTTTFQAR